MADSRAGNPSEALELAKDYFLKWQLEWFFHEIKNAGLEPRDFQWHKIAGQGGDPDALSLKHLSSEFAFGIFRNAKKVLMTCVLRPGNTGHREIAPNLTWTEVSSAFTRWLTYLKREIEAVDVWSILSQEQQLKAGISKDEVDNRHFTAEEKTRVISGLEEIRQYLLTAHRIDPELVEGHFKYLKEAADRTGRIDWKNILISTIFSIMMEAAVNSQAFHDIWLFVGAVLKKALTAPPLLGG